MKRKGTSKFVEDLIENWLNEVTDPAVLDQIIAQVEARRKKLLIETSDERDKKLIANLKDYKRGDTLYLLQPFPGSYDTGPLPARNKATMSKAQLKEYNERMRCTFYQWQPRKKRLWVTVPWKTSHQQFGLNFISMSIGNIKKYQPSRTETEIRLRLAINNRRP